MPVRTKKHVLTTEERTQRIERRSSAREAAAAKVSLLQEWRQARIARAAKEAKARAKALRAQPRGVDRVPARLRGLAVTVKPHEISKHDNPIEYGPGVKATKVHQKAPRRRSLPGAVDRRIERNRQAWSS